MWVRFNSPAAHLAPEFAEKEKAVKGLV